MIWNICRRWKIFRFGKIGKFSSKIWLFGIFAVEENFPINRKIFHFSNFFKNSEIKSENFPLCQHTRNNQNKILSIFWDIPKNMVFFSKNSKNSLKKKIVRNFFQYLKFLKIFEFFTKDVSNTLLRGREIVEKKYWVFFEIFPKNTIFFDCACPSTTTTTIHHHHHHHPSVNIKKSRGQKRPISMAKLKVKKPLL